MYLPESGRDNRVVYGLDRPLLDQSWPSIPRVLDIVVRIPCGRFGIGQMPVHGDKKPGAEIPSQTGSHGVPIEYVPAIGHICPDRVQYLLARRRSPISDPPPRASPVVHGADIPDTTHDNQTTDQCPLPLRL